MTADRKDVVCWESPTDSGVLALVESALAILNRAETLHGQPLFYDDEGRDLDMGKVLGPTIDDLKECIKAGPAGGPWK